MDEKHKKQEDILPVTAIFSIFALSNTKQLAAAEPAASPLEHIYVPADAIDTYKAADGWKEHANIIQAIPQE